jgi:hypothetical protein
LAGCPDQSTGSLFFFDAFQVLRTLTGQEKELKVN